MNRLLAILALIVLSPLLAICSLAVVCRDGIPIFYGDRRIGRGGAPFTLWKFRTMRNATGPRITAMNDTRITRLGRWLRRTKLDELPQLWNVARGEMNLVGPRPETPEFVDAASPVWQEILSVAPGITGAATLAGFDEASLLAVAPDPVEFYRTRLLPEKLALETAWLRSHSRWSDAGLVARTVAIVFHTLGDVADWRSRAR